jgi:septation ring formation regulator EzrA
MNGRQQQAIDDIKKRLSKETKAFLDALEKQRSVEGLQLIRTRIKKLYDLLRKAVEE